MKMLTESQFSKQSDQLKMYSATVNSLTHEVTQVVKGQAKLKSTVNLALTRIANKKKLVKVSLESVINRCSRAHKVARKEIT